MQLAGLNMGQVKKNNRAAILGFINANGPVSRKDIAKATGLTPASVTQITAELCDEALLKETGETVAGGGAGRKKVLLDIDWDAKRIFSVVIEPQNTVVALTNLRGKPVDVLVEVTDRRVEPEMWLDHIGDMAEKMASKHKIKLKSVAAVSVGITGPVDRSKGLSIKAYDIWDRPVAVAKVLEQKLGIPVLLENNVNAFSIAEFLFGKGREHDDILLVKWGPGVGSSIIKDGVLFEGKIQKAAELGHFIVNRDGERCSCGKVGCLQTLVSYQALKKYVNSPMDQMGTAIEKLTDSREKEAVYDSMEKFAECIVNSVTLLASDVVILCGAMFASPSMREKIINQCRQFDSSLDDNRIFYTSLRDCESYIGPVADYVYREIFKA